MLTPPLSTRCRDLAYGATAVGAGVMIGALYNLVTRHVELAVVFPLLAGLVAGALTAIVIRLTRPGSLRGLAVACVAAGALAYASSFYFDYQEYRADIAHAGGAHLSAADVDQTEARLLGSPGFLSYLDARARYGVGALGTQARTAAASGETEWLLWAAQVALAGVAGAYAGRRVYRSTRTVAAA
jgi:hypothetical protein